MSRVTLFLICFCVALPATAQIKDDEPVSHSDATWMERHYFHSIGATILADLYIPPAVRVEYIYESGNGFDTTYFYSRCFGFNLASVTYDARLNLYDINERMSLSFNIPFAFGFGPVEPGGISSFSTPLLLEFNYGNHSTYNNIDRLGFHIGIGYDVMITPVIYTDRNREINRLWGSPMLRAGFKGPYKRHNSFVAFQMSVPRRYFDESENKEYVDRYHFKIVVGWLLGYD